MPLGVRCRYARRVTEKKSPFAAIEHLHAVLPAGPTRAAPDAPKKDDPFEAKVVVASTKKGRGGKTVTLVTGIKPSAREVMARDLKKALGCGATLEDDAIALHGDVGDRVRPWLEARGAQRLVVGS